MSISFSTLKKYLIYLITYDFFHVIDINKYLQYRMRGFELLDIKLKEMKR
jgi:hypothetical protein